MPRRLLAGLAAAAAVLALTALPTTAFAAPSENAAPAAQNNHPQADCLWYGGAFIPGDTPLNYAFPDSGAHYWVADVTIPAGATLQLGGDFAHARYQSLNAYNVADRTPVDALNDVSTLPDKGSKNPYLPGAHREGEGNRHYTVNVTSQLTPTTSTRAANTLYAGAPNQTSQMIVYRLYLPDEGRGTTGGVQLPAPKVVLADGTTLTGAAACSAVSSNPQLPPVATVPLAQYSALRNQAGKPATFPAEAVPVWRANYTMAFGLACSFLGKCSPTPARVGAQYSNIDNNYISAYINRGFGDVLVFRGQLPTTPATVAGEKRMDANADMRYWSMCTNESVVTTRVQDCAYDEQIPTDADGYYTIVISRAADRPANATARCGATWLEWPERGDGAGHLDDGFLIVRNMLPSSTFTHAVQDTKVAGDEKAVMGEYLPSGSYTTTAAYTAKGCQG